MAILCYCFHKMGGSSIKCWEEGHGFISENYILKRGVENWLKMGSCTFILFEDIVFHGNSFVSN